MRRILFLAAAILPGCAHDTLGGGRTVTDSAGVEIVELPTDPWIEARWRAVDSSSTVTIGSASGDVASLFDGVRGTLQLSDGRIVVLDRGSREVRFFSATGTHLLSIGRRGQGPGEYDDPRALMLTSADTIVVYDQPRMLNTISPDGEFVRRVRINDSIQGSIDVIGAYPDGRFLVARRVGPAESSSGRHPVSVTLLVLTQEGALLRELGTHSRGEDIYYTTSNGYPDMARSIFDPPVIHAPSRNGYVWAFPRAFQFDIWNSSGDFVRSVRVSAPLGAVTAQETADRRAVFVDRPGINPYVRQMLADNFEASDKPEHLPAFSQIIVDASERIWIREYRWRPVATHTWSVFEPDGTLVGTVQLPGQLTVHQIGDEHVLGVESDADGIETVRRYVLRR